MPTTRPRGFKWASELSAPTSEPPTVRGGDLRGTLQRLADERETARRAHAVETRLMAERSAPHPRPERPAGAVPVITPES